MNDFFTGFNYFFDGLKLIFKPGIKRFIIFPLLLNILFFIGWFCFFQHYLGEFNVWFSNYLPTWLHWLSVVIWLLFIISFFIVFIYFFMTIANIFASPFNSFLAEKVEYYLTGKMPKQQSWLTSIKDTPRIIGRQLSVLGYYLPRAICILLLFLIPVIHAFAIIAWFLFSAWCLTLTYVDYPTDNHHIPVKTVRDQLLQKPYLSLGFGVCILFASMIPILNFFAIPAAVAAATKFWVNEFSRTTIK